MFCDGLSYDFLQLLVADKGGWPTSSRESGSPFHQGSLHVFPVLPDLYNASKFQCARTSVDQ